MRVFWLITGRNLNGSGRPANCSTEAPEQVAVRFIYTYLPKISARSGQSRSCTVNKSIRFIHTYLPEISARRTVQKLYTEQVAVRFIYLYLPEISACRSEHVLPCLSPHINMAQYGTTPHDVVHCDATQRDAEQRGMAQLLIFALLAKVS